MASASKRAEPSAPPASPLQPSNAPWASPRPYKLNSHSAWYRKWGQAISSVKIAKRRSYVVQVELDLKNRHIAVQTERIVLEDLDLGPFEIRLHVKELGEQSPFSITALDPEDGASSRGNSPEDRLARDPNSGDWARGVQQPHGGCVGG